MLKNKKQNWKKLKKYNNTFFYFLITIKGACTELQINLKYKNIGFMFLTSGMF